MRRLALSNSNISNISIFKDVLSDSPIGNPDNQVPNHK